MKLITRDTDYAVRALIFAAEKKDEIISVSGFVKELKIPRPFLRKILQKLTKAKILESFKGLGGGFKLIKPLEEIKLVDLVKIFQGPFQLNKCIFKKKLCPERSACILKSRIEDIERQVTLELNNITLSSLI